MQSVEYEDQCYQIYMNESVKPANRIPDNKAEDAAGKYGKIAMVIFCVLLVATVVGLATIFALHFESQGAWNREALQLRRDTEKKENDVLVERHQTALALNSMNESIRSRLLEMNADISEFVSSQGHQNTYIDLILVKLLGWEKSEHVVYKYFRQAVNYGTAQTRCAGYPSGRLAAKALRDPAFVSNIIAKGYVGSSESSNQKPWIGYDDDRTEGVWIWSDGGAMNPQTTKWPSPQPDDAGGVEDCGQIWQAGSGKLFLNDNRCDMGFYYICEVDI